MGLEPDAAGDRHPAAVAPARPLPDYTALVVDFQQPRPPRVPVSVRAGRLVDEVGALIAFSAKTLRLVFRRPFQTREFIQQTDFIASVSVLPAMLVSIPFGAVIALQLGNLTRQLGAESFTGAASALATIREASPIVTALLLAGAAGTAICADLGSRTIREEIDALEVLGISTIQRLVVPRVLGCVVVAMLLNGLVSVVGVAGGYVSWFSVREERAADDAERTALSAGREAAVAFTSYDHRRLDEDLARVTDMATGEFREEFTAALGTLTAAIEDAEGISVGEVTNAGIVRSDESSAVVMAAVDASVTNTATPQPSLRRYRLQVTLVRDDGADRWLISDISPVA